MRGTHTDVGALLHSEQMDSIKSRLRYYKLVPARGALRIIFPRRPSLSFSLSLPHSLPALLCGRAWSTRQVPTVSDQTGGLQGRRLTERACTTFSTTRRYNKTTANLYIHERGEQRQPPAAERSEGKRRRRSGCCRVLLCRRARRQVDRESVLVRLVQTAIDTGWNSVRLDLREFAMSARLVSA